MADTAFEGRVVLVTGASGGIGRRIAEGVAAHGTRVASLDAMLAVSLRAPFLLAR